MEVQPVAGRRGRGACHDEQCAKHINPSNLSSPYANLVANLLHPIPSPNQPRPASHRAHQTAGWRRAWKEEEVAQKTSRGQRHSLTIQTQSGSRQRAAGVETEETNESR